MIRTGYFAKVRSYTDRGLIPISISRWSPKWLHIPEWKTVAPPEKLLVLSKKHMVTHEEYTRTYLKMLDDNKECILNEFEEFRDRDCILLCYEGPNEFCHRHLLAEWLNQQYHQENLVTELNV